MKRRALLFLLPLLCSLAFAGAARAANPVSFVVLPFQVNGPQDMAGLQTEIPALLGNALAGQGLRVVRPAEAQRLLRSQKADQLNVAAVRNIARQGKANYGIYGSLTSTGEGFSLDARLVSAAGTGEARPFFVQRKNLVDLNSAISELASSVAASAGSVASTTGGLTDIRVEGLRILDPDVVLTRINVRKGDTVTPAGLNDEIKRLWELGYFSDVTAHLENNGQVLVLTVKEKPRIDDVIIQGSDAVNKNDILAAMSSKTGSVLNERLLAQDIQKVTDLYRKEGYYLAEVNYRIEERTGKASAALVFDVKEGNKLYIKAVVIEGLKNIKEGDIKKDLALTERGLLSFFTGTGVLREEHLERDSAVLLAYCYDHGYMDAQISAPQVTYEDDGIVITYQINEGERYKINNIAFAGDLIDADARLLEITQLDDEKDAEGYFKLSVMQDDVKRLTDFYSKYGYAFAEVDMDVQKDPEGNLLNVTFMISKKQKVQVRRVTAEGNSRTRDNVILREMRLGDGDTFDGEKLRRSNERLSRLGYFSEAEIAVVPTELEDEVDLTVKVTESNTGAVMAGVGYSTFYKFGVSASVMERNLFGRGYSLMLQGFLSAKSTQFDLSFVNPRLYDTDLGFGNDTYVMWDEWDDFRKKTYGDTIRFFYPLGEYTTLGWGYRLDQYNLYDIPATAPQSYKAYEGKNWSSVLHVRLTYDSTDSRERPTRGYVARVFTEYGGGGIGGNDNFIKPVGEVQGFHSISRTNDHILHWRTRVGGVFENSSKPVPVFDRFFIGGMDTIRGYDSSDLSPRDPLYGDEIGGDRIGFANFEYIWTFERELGLAAVPFFDIGFQTDSKQTSDPFTKLKKSVGLELRWRSPMGDLRFAYGYPLDKSVRGEKLGGRFEFSMGQFF